MGLGRGGEMELPKLKRMNREEIGQVYAQGLSAIIGLVEELYDQMSAMREVIGGLSERVKELETRISKDSHNSHKPPSSDGFKHPLKSLRSESERRVGGQPGHEGKTLSLAERADEVVIHPARKECHRCGRSLERVAVSGYERRQVWDIPVVKMKVVEHRAEIKECPSCGESLTGEFPLEVSSAVHYGKRVRSIGVYLHQYQLLPYERTSQLLEEVFGCSISPATIEKSVQECSTQLEKTEQAIVEGIVRSDVMNVDETGVVVEEKLNWLHVESTQELTHYEVHEKRGREATEAIGILPRFQGSVVHDGWKSYQSYCCRHGLCNAHHLRELTLIEEEYQQSWASKMKELLIAIKENVEKEKTLGKEQLEENRKREFIYRYQTLLEEGFAFNPVTQSDGLQKRRGRMKQTPAKNLLDRLRSYQDQVLAFMEDFRIPFDNNLAERDLRMMKVQQKISGCFRTQEGAKAFCRIRGYISTMKKQSQNILEAIERVFIGNPFVPSLARSPT